MTKLDTLATLITQKLGQTLTASQLNERNKVFLDLVNNSRAERGLPPLEWSEHLTVAAKWHSDDMENRNFFKHVAPDGAPHGELFTDRILNAGIYNRGKYAHENIAKATSPETAYEKWRNSPLHWQSLMHKNARYVGLGSSGNNWTSLVSYNNLFKDPPPSLTESNNEDVDVEPPVFLGLEDTPPDEVVDQPITDEPMPPTVPVNEDPMPPTVPENEDPMPPSVFENTTINLPANEPIRKPTPPIHEETTTCMQNFPCWNPCHMQQMFSYCPFPMFPPMVQQMMHQPAMPQPFPPQLFQQPTIPQMMQYQSAQPQIPSQSLPPSQVTPPTPATTQINNPPIPPTPPVQLQVQPLPPPVPPLPPPPVQVPSPSSVSSIPPIEAPNRNETLPPLPPDRETLPPHAPPFPGSGGSGSTPCRTPCPYYNKCFPCSQCPQPCPQPFVVKYN